MKAAVMEQMQQPMLIKDVPTPSVGGDDVLIRIHACGVCHSDLHVAEGMLASFGYDPFPLILGHEITGVVEQVGAEVSHLRPGDRVGAYWRFGCGHCRYCLSGEEEICLRGLTNLQAAGVTLSGGYAQYITVRADYAMPLPPELDFVDAAPFLCAGLTMYGGFKNAGLRPGQRAAVLGIGGLGHLGVQVARAMGAEVIAITSTEDKQELAKELGAHHTLHIANSGEVGQKLLATGGADVVLSTTLDSQVIGSVMQGLLPQGALVLTGLTADPLPVVPIALISTQRRIIGSVIGSRQDLREVLQLAVQHKIRPMTESYSLEEVNKVHDRLRANQVRFRAVLTPN